MKAPFTILACLFLPGFGQELDEPMPPKEFFSLWPADGPNHWNPFEVPSPPSQPTISEIIAAMVPPEPETAYWFSHREIDDPTIDETAWAATLLPPLESLPQSGAANWSVEEPVPLYQKTFPPFHPPPAKHLLPADAIPVPSHTYANIEFRGNTALSPDTLNAIAAKLSGQPLDDDALALARDLVTRNYLEHGFINSGAVETIPNPTTGTLVIQIQEGSLADFNIINHSQRPRLRNSYLTERLKGSNGPLNISDLRQSLQILQLNPNIQRLNAELKPGPSLGEALLEIELKETEHQWSWGLDFHNARPVTVGAEQFDAWLSCSNLTGVSDAFTLRSGLLSGGLEEAELAPWKNISLSYERPLFPDDTTIALAYSRQDYTLIQEPFDNLDISGETDRFSILLKKPVLRTLSDTLTLRTGFEHQRSRTSLLGEPFSLSPGFVDGELNLTTAQLGASWLKRGSDSVLALDSALHAGLDFLGSTQSDREPDTSFLVWTASGQYLKRVGSNGDRFLLRGGCQLAFDSLPSPRQFTLGGTSSIRGYRPNHLVTDSGFFLGAEYRWQLPALNTLPDLQLEIVPFIDAGHGWNHEGDDAETLCAIGLGLTANYQDWLRASLHYGYALTAQPDDPRELSEHGIHFNLSLARF